MAVQTEQAHIEANKTKTERKDLFATCPLKNCELCPDSTCDGKENRHCAQWCNHSSK